MVPTALAIVAAELYENGPASALRDVQQDHADFEFWWIAIGLMFIAVGSVLYRASVRHSTEPPQPASSHFPPSPPRAR